MKPFFHAFAGAVQLAADGHEFPGRAQVGWQVTGLDFFEL
jgi:hypothetical protein